VKPITFTVPGKPVTQPRQKFVRATGRAYTPDNGIVAYREAIALAAKAAGATPTTEAPLTLVIDWVFVRPKSHYLASGELNPRTALPLPPGDTSNYLKGVEDALNGVAWGDDVQIGKTIMEKTYGHEARTTVRIQ
jgi:Holliday junction resolvase RusA-like endonuclease